MASERRCGSEKEPRRVEASGGGRESEPAEEAEKQSTGGPGTGSSS